MNITTTECVYFESKADSHAIASVVVPVTMNYIYSNLSGEPRLKHFKAGEKIYDIKMLMSETCGIFYSSIKRTIKKEQHESKSKAGSEN